MSVALFLLCLISSSSRVARPPTQAMAPRPAQSPQVSREVCVCSGCSGSLASLMEGSSRSRRPPSSHSTQACVSGWWVAPDSEESPFRLDGMVRRCVVDEFSSTASGEGLTNDCSDGASPDPDSSNNPELKCVFLLDNEFDFAGLEVLEGLKVDNIKPQKIISSSSWSRYTKRCLPKELDEKVAKWHFLALGPELTVFTREQADYISVKVDVPFTTVVGIQGSAEGVIASSVFDAYLPVQR